MTFSSGSFGQLLYIEESSRGETPAAGTTRKLRMTQPNMKAGVSTVKSSEIRADRLSSGLTRTDLSVDGGFNFELSAKEYDPFIAAVIGGTFAHYGTEGLGDVFDATLDAEMISAAVAPAGASAFTSLAAGTWFKVVPGASESDAVKRYFADAWFKLASSDASTLTLSSSTPIVEPGLSATGVDFRISHSEARNGPTRKTFSFEHDLTDVGSKLLYRGMEPNTMQVSIDVGAIITGSFGFIGQSHDVRDGASFLPANPAPSETGEVMNAVADVGLVYEAGVNLLDGGSFIQKASLNLNNNARGQKAVGVFGNVGVGLGELAISGEMTVYFKDSSYYRKWLEGTQTSLALGVADSTGAGYLFEIPKVMFREGSMNPGGNNEDVMLTLPFDGFFSAADGYGIRVVRAVAAP